jgi:hypothetical protein
MQWFVRKASSRYSSANPHPILKIIPAPSDVPAQKMAGFL